jgi:hypothetical protein
MALPVTLCHEFLEVVRDETLVARPGLDLNPNRKPALPAGTSF